MLREEYRDVTLASPPRARRSEVKSRLALEDLCAMIGSTMCRDIKTTARKVDARLEPLDAKFEAWLERIDARFDAIIAKLDGLIRQGKIIIWMMVAILVLELATIALLVVLMFFTDRSGSQFPPQWGAKLEICPSTDPARWTGSARDGEALEFLMSSGLGTPSDRTAP